jgi:hypothetical protein
LKYQGAANQSLSWIKLPEMRKAKVFVNDREAGILIEVKFGDKYVFKYREGYSGTGFTDYACIG